MKKSILIIASLFLLASCNSDSPSNVPATPQKLGLDSAPILVEEFADLQCPGCGVVTPQLHELIEKNSDLAHLDFYHYPLSMHQYAFAAAEASECAADQGKFWEYVLKVYENQPDLNEDYLTKVADSLKLDRTAFDQCMDDRKYKEKIQSHMAEGNKRAIPGTPTIFVNGQLVQWTDADTFEKYLKGLK